MNGDRGSATPPPVAGNDGPQPLLALLQLADSAFPSGSFAHSLGLEQLAREGLVTTPKDVERFVTSVVLGSIVSADARACTMAAEAAAVGDLAGAIEADRALLATKLAAELRAASLQTGRRLLAETAPLLDDALLSRYAAVVKQGEAPGMHAVAFGVAAAAVGVSPRDAAAGLSFAAANGLLQAAMRILPFSHRDAQAVLHGLRGRITAALTPTLSPTSPSTGLGRGSQRKGEQALTPTLSQREREQAPWEQDPEARELKEHAGLRSFHPLQEIAAMRHTRAPVRLFSS